jgi:hypothetical protein
MQPTMTAQREPKRQLDLDVKVPLSIRWPKSVDRAVEIAAAQRDCSKWQLITDAVVQYLATDSAGGQVG